MNKMVNRYKSKEGGTMIPLRFQNGGSNLFLTMPNGGNVGSIPAGPGYLPEYQVGANTSLFNQDMRDLQHYYSPGYPILAEGGDTDMDGDDQSFYSNRMNTFIQKIRDNAEKKLQSAVMEQDQQPPMAAYGMSMGSDPMNSYDPGNLGAFARASNYMRDLGNNAVSGYIQRMGDLGPNNYYYKEKNIYKDTSKNAPLGSQKFIDADGNESTISPEEALNRANYALYSRKQGGALPKAQTGIVANLSNPELYMRALQMGHENIEDYKNSNWGYGKNHPEYKKSSYPNKVKISDPRIINATSGKPINPNVDLKSGSYNTGVIGEIARAAKEFNLDPQELMAIALQETNLGNTDPNYGHVLDYADPERRGPAYDMALAKIAKDKVAEKAGFGNDELRKLQAYNGLGTVYPSTEADYHGFNMSSIYGVPLPKSGISMVQNPLYGKRIVDLRDNVLKNSANAEYNQFLDKYNRDLANEEAISQKQIAAYNMFNGISPEYGNQYRDMLQKAYNDSIGNASFETFYPGADLEYHYDRPNLDYIRQSNMLNRFNKGIGYGELKKEDYGEIPFKNGGALTKYQQDINSGQPGTTGDGYWSAEELTYLNGLPKAERNKIISKGDKAREAYQTYRTANDKPVAKTDKPAVKTEVKSNTANNTDVNTNTNTTVPKGTETIGVNNNPNMLYDGHNTTSQDPYKYATYNGQQYLVGPNGQLYAPYSGAASSQNVYTPQNYYNPYTGYRGGINLGVISKNRLTPEFRKNMLEGSYGNPQLLGVSEIKTRRAMDPGNRIKSITYSYGQPIPSGRTTVNNPGSTTLPPRASSTTPVAPGAGSTTSTKVNPQAPDPNDPRVISPAVKAAEDYTFRPWQNLQNMPAEGPINQNNGAGPRDTPSPDVTYDPFVSSYVPRYNTYPDLDNSGKVSPVRVMANNTVPETDTDPYTDPATDPRGVNYGKEDYPEDLVLPESGKVVKGSDNNYYVKLPDGTIEKSMDREVLRKKTGFAKGGALHKFMRMYQGDLGPSSVRDMSIADLPDNVDQIVEPESNNTPMDFKPYEMTDADRIRAVDVGTEYEQAKPEDGMAPSFDVTTKRKKKRIGNPEKDLAFINMATGLFNAKNAAYVNAEYKKRTTAANNFKPIRDFEGDYDILSGDFRKGSRAAGGNDKFHSGFGNYAQMGGNMLNNLKEGDEVYLTEEQINEIIKRGGKLSYL